MSYDEPGLFSRVSRAALNRSVTQLRVAGMESTLDAQLENMIARFVELRRGVREYHSLRREIKALMGNERLMKAGCYEIHANTLQVTEKCVSGYSATRLVIK